MTLQADGEPLSAIAFGPHYAGDGQRQQDCAPRELFAILRSLLGNDSWLRGRRLTDRESDKPRGRAARSRGIVLYDTS
jgi:hypothetical protein